MVPMILLVSRHGKSLSKLFGCSTLREKREKKGRVGRGKKDKKINSILL